jgi:hypothetical protein
MTTQLNPLNIIKKRKVKNLPNHFLKVKIYEFDLSQNKLENWIISRLSGRYSIVKIPSVDQDNSLNINTYIGFEQHKEMTYFMLACPHFRRT